MVRNNSKRKNSGAKLQAAQGANFSPPDSRPWGERVDRKPSKNKVRNGQKVGGKKNSKGVGGCRRVARKAPSNEVEVVRGQSEVIRHRFARGDRSFEL